MYFSTTLLAAVFAVGSSAHATMSNPKPFQQNLDNSPLVADGSNFPCKQPAGATYSASGVSNQITLGGTHDLSFVGGATHGGGSCQISITYDQNPTKNSVWKAIYSIEGGCPSNNTSGNDGNSASTPNPAAYSFTVPSDIPTGNAVLAWTWFNRIGNREMYMNCAPVTISGGSKKRDEADMKKRASAYDSLPAMFVANIGNGCSTQDTTDLAFPNPGNFVDKSHGSKPLVPPVGNCAAAVSGGSGSGPSSGPGPSSSPGSSPGSGPGSSAGAAAPPQSSATASSQSQGGIFITQPAGAGATAAATPTAASVPSQGAASPAAPAASVPAQGSSAAAAPAPASTGSSSSTAGAFAAGTACTTEGQWNCIGSTSFQQCASGMWSAVQQMAAGTQCTPGQSSSFKMAAVNAKRDVRFSPEHLRRRHGISH